MFVFSKLFGYLSAPGELILLTLLVGVGLWLTGRRIGRALALFACVCVLLLAVFPLGKIGTAVLEDRFPRPPLPDRVDGIVVLSGLLDPLLTQQRGQLAVGGSVERLLEFMRLGRLYPGARMVFSGGSGSVLDPELREADDARILMHELGFDTSRVVFERVSRNTWENAVMSREAVSPESGEVWVLVTSAAHMPRAVGCFRKAGFPVLPWPVDYATPGLALIRPRLSLLGGLANLNTAAHEWLGLVAYSLLGRTSELFPGPVRREIREHSLTQ